MLVVTHFHRRIRGELGQAALLAEAASASPNHVGSLSFCGAYAFPLNDERKDALSVLLLL